jgi:hypothetical protein
MALDRPDPVVAKRLLVCDRIERRADGGVNLINLWLLKRLPTGWAPGSFVPPWAAFAWLTNGRGKVRFRSDIAEALPDGQLNPLWRSDLHEALFSDPIETRFLCIAISNLKINAPGDFLVELNCQDDAGNFYYLDELVVTFEA